MNYLSSNVPSLKKLFLFSVLLATCFPVAVFAAQWQVIPIRLDLNHRAKSGVITVKNSADEILHLSVLAKQWEQDETGKDIYTDTSELIFFPKLLQVKPGGERVVRVGIKAPAIKQEQAFRLYIKEEAAPNKRSNQVAVAIQFGAPVFVQPLEEKIVGEIDEITVSDEKINFSVRNRGNAHFRTTRLEVIGKDIAGQQLFSQELKGWYVLADAAQFHEVLIPLKMRNQLATIDIKIITDRMELFKTVDFNGIEKVPPKAE